jgi:hypothetical protein
MKLNRCIAFLDVLGFSDLLNNNKPEDIEVIYTNTITEALSDVFIETKKIEHDPLFKALLDATINYSVVSDSIIIWTVDDSFDSLMGLSFIVKFLLGSTLIRGIPLRGAICSGPLVVVKNKNSMNIVGSALTNAYNLEKKQQWSGCVIDSNLISKYSSDSWDMLFNENVIVKYQVPYNSGEIKDEYTINWPSSFSDTSKIDELIFVEYLFSLHNKSINDWGARQKIRNTFDFIKSIKLQPENELF